MNVLAISHFDKANHIFEGYCEGVKANSSNYHYIDYLDLYLQKGKKGCEGIIEKLVIEENINCIFLILRSADLTFDISFMERLSRRSFIVMNFFDTLYYFEPVDRYYAQTADLVLLPEYLSKYNYESLGIKALCTFSLFNSNHYSFLNNSTKNIDVSFVGNLATADRKEYADCLIDSGISVSLYGANTANGFIDFNGMIKVFNDTRINLNFTGMITKGVRYSTLFSLNIHQRMKQVKGRPIEIALCGGFVLSEYAPGIEEMFKIGEEMDVFRTKEELLEKVRYYLNNDEERERIARRGYERAIRDYDCVNGFAKVFAIITDQRKAEKRVYLDKDFIRNYVSYRFFYITLFALGVKIKPLLEEIGIIFKYRRLSLSMAFNYILKAAGLYMRRFPRVKRKVMGVLRIPYRD